jgi:GNAT superfamily N-acetyltransferase
VTAEIRLLTPADDLEAFGRIVLASYTALPDHPSEPEYERELVDVRARVTESVVYGAFVHDVPAGCVTFVADRHSAHAENLLDGESSFRMLAVSQSTQGRGVGEALVQRCLSAARDIGSVAVFIYSGSWMHAAHRLYGRLGFARTPGRDWIVDDPPITLYGFRKEL